MKTETNFHRNKLLFLYAWVIIMLIPSCNKDPYLDLNLSTFEEQSNFEDSIILKYGYYLEEAGYNYAINKILSDLENANLNELEINPDSTGIFWTYEDGTRCCFCIKSFDEGQMGKESLNKRISNFVPINNLKIGANESIKNNSALILSPISWQLGDYDNTELISEMLERSQFNVKYKKNISKSSSTISFNDFSDWDQYGLIYIETHGTIDPRTNQFILSSGIKYTKTLAEEHKAEIKAKKITKFLDSKFYKAFGFTPEWFLVMFPTPPEDMLFFITACYSTRNASLRNVFIGSSNESCIFGWDGSISVEKAFETGLFIFQSLLDEKLNCWDSYGKALQAGMVNYDDGGKDVILNLYGNKEIFLIEDDSFLQEPFNGDALNNDVWEIYDNTYSHESGLNMYVNDTLIINRGANNDNNGFYGIVSKNQYDNLTEASVDVWMSSLHNWQDHKVTFHTPIAAMGYYNYGSYWFAHYINSDGNSQLVKFADSYVADSKYSLRIRISENKLLFEWDPGSGFVEVFSTTDFSTEYAGQWPGLGKRVMLSNADRGYTKYDNLILR